MYYIEVLHNQHIMNKMRMRAQSLVLFLSTEFPLYLLTTGYVSAEPTSRLRATEQQQQLQKKLSATVTTLSLFVRLPF